eukprot:11201016-Lingulodinium_polyedra.AAC.1
MSQAHGWPFCSGAAGAPCATQPLASRRRSECGPRATGPTNSLPNNGRGPPLSARPPPMIKQRAN